MLTVRIVFLDGRDDEIKDCWDVSQICLDGVEYIKIIRQEKAA